MVDLCKLGEGNNVPDAETNLYFYDSDGNSAIIEDNYGDKLNQMSLDEAIAFFEKQTGYRRVDILLATMKSIKDNFGSFSEDMFVLFYGH